MEHRIKTKMLLIITLIACLGWHTAAHSNNFPPPKLPVPVTISVPPVDPYTEHYIYETITVPGVDFLEVTASNNNGHYAGNTKNADGKLIAFTLIDGVFTTYDVPDSGQTVFYGLNNAGQAAGFYEDQNEITHGIILQDGELKVWNFPGALNTQIFGIGEDGQLLGDTIDENGNIQGFVGKMQFNVHKAMSTYADDINAAGIVVGSYIDSEGIYHGFYSLPDGSIHDIDIPNISNLEYLFVNAINDIWNIVFRAKVKGDIERSYVLHLGRQPLELRYPGSVETVLRDIDSQGRITGYYDTPDGRRHGCVVIPSTKEEAEMYSNIFRTHLTQGLNMLSMPLASSKPMTAKSLAGLAGATVVITLDAENQSFVGWTPSAPNDGFAIEGGQGYIVNVTQARDFAVVGAHWTNPGQASAAAPIAKPSPKPGETWAFVVSGHLDSTQQYDGYHITVRNLRTNSVMTTQVSDNYFAAATADLTRRSVVQVGDALELTVTDTTGNVASETYIFKVTPDNLTDASLSVQLDSIGQPNKNQLLQNYPNPFNPETWIPYQLSQDSPVSISIYGTTGKLIRTLSLGIQSAGYYNSRGRAAYWDGRNALGEQVASGVYFYQLTTPSFQQTRRLVILK